MCCREKTTILQTLVKAVVRDRGLLNFKTCLTKKNKTMNGPLFPRQSVHDPHQPRGWCGCVAVSKFVSVRAGASLSPVEIVSTHPSVESVFALRGEVMKS